MIQTINKKHPTYLVLLTILALVGSLLSSFILVASTTTPAYAASCDSVGCTGSGIISVDVDAGAGGGGNSTGPGAGNDGGNGGGSTAPPTNYTWSTFTCWWVDPGGSHGENFLYPADTNAECFNRVPMGGGFADTKMITCKARNGNTPALAISVRYSVVNSVPVLSGYSCQYPPHASPNTLLGSKVCFINYDSALYYSTNKNSIRRGGSLADVAKGSNRYNNIPVGVADYNNCTRSFKATKEYFTKSPEDGGYGYYRADANNVKAVNCSWYGFPRWVGDTSRDRYTCGGQYNYPASGHSYAVYSCSTHFANYGANWARLPKVNFDVSACANFDCKMTGSEAVNGSTNPAEVMRDGNLNTISTPQMSLVNKQGVRNVKNIQGKFTVKNGSSPRNTSVSDNSSKQYFKLYAKDGRTKQNFGTWYAQSPTNYLAFYWASTAGKNFKVDKQYRFSAQFYVFDANTTGGDGSMKWQNSTYTYKVNDRDCSAHPPAITVLRSANQ